MKKRILSLFLCLVMVCAALTVTAFAVDEDYTFDSTTGALTVNTAAGVTAWEGVVDPEDIKSVTVASAVTEIPGDAFQGLSNLESVEFKGAIEIKDGTMGGADVNYIITAPFSNTMKLASITFGGAAKLGDYAFVAANQHNTALKRLVFPEGSTFGMHVFQYYDALEEVTFEGDIDFDTKYAFNFSSCPKLKKVTFEGDCTIIDYGYAFAESPNIAKINFGGAAKLGDYAFSLFSDNPNTALKSVTLPDGSSVGNDVFSIYDALQSIVFEGSFDLKEHAFTNYDVVDNEYQDFAALNAIYFTSVTPPAMKSSAFGGINPDNVTVYVPCCSVEDYKDELAKDTGTDPDVTYNSEFVDKVVGFHDWVKTDSHSHTCTYCSETEDHNFSGHTCVDCGYTKHAKWIEKSAVFPFTDVKETDWSYDDIYYVWEKGLMQGTSETTFAPKIDTSRAMIVTILWRLEGEPVVNYAMSFDDVADGQWYTEAIRWAQSTGIVKGYSADEFGPDDPITREQMAAILYRYAQSKGEGFTGSWMFLLEFKDAAQVSDWADEAMHWCVMKGLINGVGNDLLDPQGYATREQVAAILHRFCENIVK